MYQYQYIPPSKKRRRGQAARKQAKKGEEKKVKAVMFIPYTTHSELATRLRENEDKMQEMTGYRLKIVEKGGTKLVDILHKAYPGLAKSLGGTDACCAHQRRGRARRKAKTARKETVSMGHNAGLADRDKIKRLK